MLKEVKVIGIDHDVKKLPGGRGKDITGHRYGRLTAICPTEKRNYAGSLIWKCKCDCGRETEATVNDLKKGNTRSCGCLKKEYQKLVHDRLHLIDGTCVEWLGERKDRSDNTSGFRGIFKRKSGKYSASIGFKKKIYYIGTFEEFDEAVEARLQAEHIIYEGFLTSLKLWEKMAEENPVWAKENPFLYDISKENGILVVHNSMKYHLFEDLNKTKCVFE